MQTIGLHLTLTSEWETYRWGPISRRDKVLSLVDSMGYFYSTSEEASQHITVDDAEREIRAQIEMASKMGFHPTHLDSHMGGAFLLVQTSRRPW